MIPKIIHYCWFGGNSLPQDVIKCIESWKKFCPNYEIKEWNETNFDYSICKYALEAFEAKKWAFLSDYARFWILYNYGGLYFDTDVEIIKGIDDLVEKGSFMCSEFHNNICRIATGLGICAESGNIFYKEVLDYYSNLQFKISDKKYNEETVVTYVTDLAKRHGYKGDGTIENIHDITIYTPEYFCPLNGETGICNITVNTRTIHWYSASWKDKKEIEIHKKAIEIYNNNFNIVGWYISRFYENIMKTMYYVRKEGILEVLDRVIRKIKRYY